MRRHQPNQHCSRFKSDGLSASLARLVVACGLSIISFGALPNDRLVEIKWSATGHFEHQTQVKPNAFFELCGELGAGDAVSWRFEATQPLDFNIHHHSGKDVIYSDRRSKVAMAADVLNAGVRQTYCWMWVNKEPALGIIKMKLRR